MGTRIVERTERARPEEGSAADHGLPQGAGAGVRKSQAPLSALGETALCQHTVRVAVRRCDRMRWSGWTRPPPSAHFAEVPCGRIIDDQFRPRTPHGELWDSEFVRVKHGYRPDREIIKRKLDEAIIAGGSAFDGYAEIDVTDETRLKCAAVLVPLLWQDDQWNLLFTRRTDHVESHKGQVSFPGGGCDEGEINAGGNRAARGPGGDRTGPEDVRDPGPARQHDHDHELSRHTGGRGDRMAHGLHGRSSTKWRVSSPSHYTGWQIRATDGNFPFREETAA